MERESSSDIKPLSLSLSFCATYSLAEKARLIWAWPMWPQQVWQRMRAAWDAQQNASQIPLFDAVDDRLLQSINQQIDQRMSSAVIQCKLINNVYSSDVSRFE